MKKLILAAAALFVFFGASAQYVDWGIKAGLNVSGMTHIDDSKAKASVYAGVFAQWRINDYIGIQPEVLYSRQGFTHKIHDNDNSDKVWNRFNYLNIPVLARIYVLNQLSLDVGPQFGILLNAKARTKIDGTKRTEDINGAKNFDFSVPVGLTWNFMPSWDLSARYNIGVTKVFDVADNDKPKNSVFQLGLGYRF